MNTPRFISLSRLGLIGSAALLLTPLVGSAASLTWKGNTSTDIAAANWLNGTNPAAPASGDSLYFGAPGVSGSTTLGNSGNLTIANINFNSGAPAYTLTGNAITIGGGITNNSTSIQTINTDLALNATTTVTSAANGGNVVIGGNISGSNVLNVKGSGTTTLSGSNNLTNYLSVGGGTLVINGDSSSMTSYIAVGSNQLIVNGAGKLGSQVLPGSGSVVTIDNTGTNLSDRLAKTAFRGQGGQLNFISANVAGGSTDTLAKLQLDCVVHTTINLVSNASGQTVLKANDVARATGATLLIQGNNLGSTAGANNTNFIVLPGGTSGGLTWMGSAGAAGTTTMSILPYAVGRDTAKTGNDQYGFMTAYAGGSLDTTNGFRTLTLDPDPLKSEYFTTINNNATVLNNVNLATGVTGLTGSATKINSLRLDNGGSVAISGTLTINSGAILALSGNGGISGGTLYIDNRDFVFTTISDLSVSSSFATKSGSTGITKTGDGMLTLSASSSYVGTNNLNAGSVKLVSGGNLGAGGNTLNIDGVNTQLDLNGNSLTVGALNGAYSSTTVSIINNGTQAVVLTLGKDTLAASNSYVGRILDGTSQISIVKTGSNTQTLSGSNSYSGGTTVESGTLKAGIANAFGAAAGTLTVNGGVVDMAGFSANIGALNGTGTIRNSATSGTAVITLGNGDNSGSYSGQVINDTVAKFNLVKTGTGTQILSGANTYTGTTSINAGTLQFTKKVSLYNGGTAAAWSAANIKVANGATLAVNVGGADGFSASDVASLLGIGGSAATGFVTGSIIGLDTTNGDFEYSSAIGNAYSGSTLGLKKLGQNTLILSGANTYSGTTTVAAGTLNIKGSLAGGPVNVANGATLGGIGSVGGALTISGKLAAGDGGVGTLKTANLTFGSTGTFDVELGNNRASDKVAVTGSVNINDGAELKLSLATGATAPVAGDIFFLVDNDASEAIVGKFSISTGSGLVTLTEGSQFQWNNQYWTITYMANAGTSSFTDGNDIAIQVVPEPATWALLVGGMGMLISMRKLHKHSTVS